MWMKVREHVLNNCHRRKLHRCCDCKTSCDKTNHYFVNLVGSLVTGLLAGVRTDSTNSWHDIILACLNYSRV